MLKKKGSRKAQTIDKFGFA